MRATSTLITKLQLGSSLEPDDIGAIERLPIVIKDLPTHTSVVREGDRPTQCCVLIEGFLCRSKTTDAGKRQILSVHIPGDIPDLQTLHLNVMDHDFKALSDCSLGFIPHESLRALIRARPMIAEALWRETLVDAAIFREWIVNVGRRAASQRLAHFLLEMRRRLERVGLASNGHFPLPMTQLDLADTVGLTPVHINRVIQSLRQDKLLDFRKYVVT